MISKFYLQNFKSFKQEICADIEDLVVTAGSNSCGKTTLIQGLLLLAQTLDNPNRNEVLDLGGRYIQFSQFRDAVYGRPSTEKANFRIGFDIEIPGSLINKFGSEEGIQNTEKYFKFLAQNPSRIRAQTPDHSQKYHFLYVFGATRNGEPVIKSAEFTKRIGEMIEIKFQIERFRNKYRTNYQVKSLAPQKELDNGEEILNELERIISSYIPTDEAISRTYAKHDLLISRRSRERYSGINRLVNFLGIDISDIPEIGGELEFKLRTICDLIPFEASSRELSELIHKVIIFSLNKGFYISSTLSIDFDHFNISDYYTSHKFEPLIDRYFHFAFDDGINQVKNFLSNLIYIGPLRAKPERVYLSLGNPLDMGISGENAVPVLWLNQNEKVVNKTQIGSEPTIFKLSLGVKQWLDEFGIASTFHITKPKHVIYQAEIESSPDSHIMVTIADVGFGVSQLLPVIVAGLRAPKGSTLILEQPEIHLHPRLQGKLADFLICMIELGKKIIVETHSEHLINMLRLRIIEDQSGKLRNRIRIIFVKRYDKGKLEKDDDRKGSYIENLQVDEYGKIINWPPDFFPESSNLSEAILKAMMDKFEQGQ